MGLKWWVRNGKYFGTAYKKELAREKFWEFVMYKFPKIYKWCDENLKCDTLPF